MKPLAGTCILTAAAMRAAEQGAIDRGATIDSLMARAGQAVALAVHRLAAGAPVLVACGPGNNGGDGYVAAAALKAMGMSVRIAATGQPQTDAAARARKGWSGPVEALADAEPAPVLLDGLFGTGLSRPLGPAILGPLQRLLAGARLAIAIDLPSGVETDTGAILAEAGTDSAAIRGFDVTLALGSAKPAHVLQPAAGLCGIVRSLDIGIAASGEVLVLARPDLAPPPTDAHKFSRGMVAVIAGAMRGASELAAGAALRAGAGYVTLIGGGEAGAPHAVVRRPFGEAALADDRIGALLIGPGLGRDDAARARLDRALATDRPLVVDGDALHLVTADALRARTAPVIVTPHAGEFAALFGRDGGSKIDRARAAAIASGATVVFKGPDTVVAAPDGAVRVAEKTPSWLSTAGTGDVLAGAIAAQLASGVTPLDAAANGVWLHGEAARRLGGAFIADDLATALTAARAGL